MTENYRRAKLRGKSFRGCNLSGVDFTGADIRGADFSGANLFGANFSHTTAGLQRRWAFLLIILTLILAALSGFLAAVGGSLVGVLLLGDNRENLYVGIICLVAIAIFFLITVRRGVAAAFGFLAFFVTCAGIAAVGWAGVVAVTWAGGATTTGAMEIATNVAVIVSGVVAVLGIIAGTVAIAGTVTLAGTLAGMFAVAVTVAIAGMMCGVVSVTALQMNMLTGSVAIAIAVCVVLLSAYIGCQALFEDTKQSVVRKAAISLATRHGTNFQNSDLTDAQFTKASLKNANFSQANLTRTCWFQAKNMHLADIGKSYLNNDLIRELVTTKNLQSRNLDHADLQGINLEGAILKDATLIGTKLNASNLRNADISRATLVKTEVDRTDFRGALLTGAYIQDWGITPDTNLEDVKCEYIFMRIPNKENPNPCRLPANWGETFKEGEFTKLFRPVAKVVRIK